MNAVEVMNIKKKFRVYYDKGQSFKERVLFRNRNHYEDRWVLKGLSFSVKKGEAIGLIGENGCGKSTTLKLLTRIMYPNEGSIKINGRVSSLIELGAGFHPDMSGRENIYTNASIFGLSRREIDARIKDIIEFSELEEFIDNPVRTYSSGMYMRLAFAVAINVDADVLLIDEILAVGDASFQAKCFNKMREIKASGATIIIVSHSLGQIEQICDRTIWIDAGKICMEGKPRDIHPYYLEFMGQHRRQQDVEVFDQLVSEVKEKVNEKTIELEEEKPQLQNRWGNKDVEITKVVLYNNLGVEQYSYKTGEKMRIDIHYIMHRKVDSPTIGIGIFRNDGTNCYGVNTLIDRIEEIKLKKQGIISFEIESNNLLAGEYSLDIAFHAIDGFPYDYFKGIKQFQVYSEIQDVGIMRLDHKWIVK